MPTDETIRELERTFLEEPTDENLERLIRALKRIYGDDWEEIIRRLPFSEGEKEELIKVVRDYLLNQGKTAKAAARLAEAINKLKALGRRLKINDLIGVLKRAGVIELAEWAFIIAGAPLALLFIGLVLPASKLGEVEWDWGGYFRDPCADLLNQINDSYADQQVLDSGYATSRDDAVDALDNCGSLITLCGRYLRDCPAGDAVSLVKSVLQTAESQRDKYLNWLASH